MGPGTTPSGSGGGGATNIFGIISFHRWGLWSAPLTTAPPQWKDKVPSMFVARPPDPDPERPSRGTQIPLPSCPGAHRSHCQLGLGVGGPLPAGSGCGSLVWRRRAGRLTTAPLNGRKRSRVCLWHGPPTPTRRGRPRAHKYNPPSPTPSVAILDQEREVVSTT